MCVIDKKCAKCAYFQRSIKIYDHFADSYSRGCSRFSYTNDYYDQFNRLIYCVDKSCFVPARQITMEILEENK